MTVKSMIKEKIFQRGIIVNRSIPKSDVLEFLARFREKYEAVHLVRIGGDLDGGYLLPNHLSSIEYCYSPGVDYTANFESQLSSEYGIKSFMADASVLAAPLQDDNFSFIPKFLGSKTQDKYITLSDWMNETLGDSPSEKILQMDIEGGEYDVLTYESAEQLAQFSSMIIEFHGLQNIFEKSFFQMLSAIFEKIYKNFSICHVHPNNCCGIASLKGIEVPRVIEVSFIRNDILEKHRSNQKISLPHPLDVKNIVTKPDIKMPDIWWKD